MSKLVRYDFKLDKGEQRDVVIKLPEEKRGVIHGVVVDEHGKPIKDAVVKLFVRDGRKHDKKDDKWDDKRKKDCDLEPISHTFTDECGQFLFGPLCEDKKYTIKVWVNDTCIAKDYVSPDFRDVCIRPIRCDKDHCKDHHKKDDWKDKDDWKECKDEK